MDSSSSEPIKEQLDFLKSKDLNKIRHQIHLRDICRTFYLTTEYTFFITQGTLSRIDNMSDCKTILSKFKIVNQSNHNGMKTEINNRRKTETQIHGN